MDRIKLDLIKLKSSKCFKIVKRPIDLPNTQYGYVVTTVLCSFSSILNL